METNMVLGTPEQLYGAEPPSFPGVCHLDFMWVMDCVLGQAILDLVF